MRLPVTSLLILFVVSLGCAASNETPVSSGGAGGKATGGSSGSGGTKPTGSGGAGSGGSSASGGTGGSTSGTGGATATGGAGAATGGAGGSTPGTGGATGGAGGSASPDVAATETAPSPGTDGPTTFEGSHPQCPNCKSIFDGKTLTGWTPIGAEKWAADNGAILSTGAAAGVLVTAKAYDHYRLIYSWQMQDMDGHQANMVVFCRSASARYCGGVQFQPPGTDIWDYGPANKSLKGQAGLMKAPVEKGQAGQCEMIVNHTAGTFKVACCNLMGGKTCKAQPVGALNYGKVPPGAFGWQAHNPNHKIRWWNIFVEEMPASDEFVTTK